MELVWEVAPEAALVLGPTSPDQFVATAKLERINKQVMRLIAVIQSYGAKRLNNHGLVEE
jgi:hypothetical protein